MFFRGRELFFRGLFVLFSWPIPVFVFFVFFRGREVFFRGLFVFFRARFRGCGYQWLFIPSSLAKKHMT